MKAKLGQKMAAYYFQGAAEAILQCHPLPTIIEPKGAVPKKGKDEFRKLEFNFEVMAVLSYPTYCLAYVTK